MDDKAKRIHSIRRLVWTLGIVNVVALLMLFTFYGVMTGKTEASIVEVRQEAEATESGQHLLQAYGDVNVRYGRATLWTCVVLVVELVVLAVIDFRLAKELPELPRTETTKTPADQ
jgi:SNF family Na+-dependent transporter